jgi:hypothetical protein
LRLPMSVALSCMPWSTTFVHQPLLLVPFFSWECVASFRMVWL